MTKYRHQLPHPAEHLVPGEVPTLTSITQSNDGHLFLGYRIGGRSFVIGVHPGGAVSGPRPVGQEKAGA